MSDDDLSKWSKSKLAEEVRRLRSIGRIALSFERWRLGTHIIVTGIHATGLIAVAYYAYHSIDTLAGRTTAADIGLGIRILGNVTISHILAWTVGIGGVGFGLVQSRLKKATIEKGDGRLARLEKQLDPKRTSSNLTPRGDTRPEDLP